MDFTVIIQIIVKLFENPIAIFFAVFLFLLLSSSFILKLFFLWRLLCGGTVKYLR